MTDSTSVLKNNFGCVKYGHIYRLDLSPSTFFMQARREHVKQGDDLVDGEGKHWKQHYTADAALLLLN